jgi:hypothetical protein
LAPSSVRILRANALAAANGCCSPRLYRRARSLRRRAVGAGEAIVAHFSARAVVALRHSRSGPNIGSCGQCD